VVELGTEGWRTPDKKPDKRFPALRLSLRARREANAASRDRNNRRVYAVIMRHGIAKICAKKHKNATFFECLWIFAKNRRRGDTKRQHAPKKFARHIDTASGGVFSRMPQLGQARFVGSPAEYHSCRTQRINYPPREQARGRRK